MLNGAILAALLIFLSVSVRIFTRSRRPFPRVGAPGPFGYVWTVIRSVIDCDRVVEEGCKQFGGKTFVLPSLGGEIIIMGPENVETLRRSDDTVVSTEFLAYALLALIYITFSSMGPSVPNR